jgi:hypothetical protein
MKPIAALRQPGVVGGFKAGFERGRGEGPRAVAIVGFVSTSGSVRAVVMDARGSLDVVSLPLLCVVDDDARDAVARAGQCLT